MVGTERGHQRADWNHNHGQQANLITRTTALSNSMKLSHALWGHPRWVGHGGEVWQNVVHWRRKWQTTSLFLLWEPHEEYEKAKKIGLPYLHPLKDELPRSVGAQYAIGDQWRNNSRKNEGMKPKQIQHSVVDETVDRSKVWCCQEQYCIGTWNVRSTNQGILEVVKQEMTRVNINILGISKLRWTGLGEFNSRWPFYLLLWAGIP